MNGNAKCAICTKTVYAMERMDADGMSFHKVYTHTNQPTHRCSTLCRVFRLLVVVEVGV
jgi:hypothetical protein